MQKSLIVLATVLSLTIPGGAFAMQTQTLDFAEGRINADWVGQGDIKMQQAKDGILLETGNGTGLLLTTLAANFQPQASVIQAASPVPSRFYFAWIMTSGPGHSTFTMPINLTTGTEEEQDFSLQRETEWRTGEKKIGIVLPPHTTIMLMRIELKKWNMFEQSLEVVKSFWTFDELRPYSINFVWGPQVGLNSFERSQLYTNLPPAYYSGTLILNAAIILILLAIGATGKVRKTPQRNVILQCAVVLFAGWILLDVRMGSEFLSWVWHDRETYIAADAEERTFRDRDRFYDFAEFSKQYLKNRNSYVFFAEHPWPYLGAMRYVTYPSIPGIDYFTDDTWVIYQRADMGVDQAGHMTIDGQSVSPAGKVLGRFDKNSFIFRVSK